MLKQGANMYSTILVPLDGSKRAEAILPHVEQLARRCEARVIFMQVVESVYVALGLPEISIGLNQGLTQQRADEAATYLAGWQREFREKGIEAVTRVEHGPVVETIIGVAGREGADLIALASHGRSGLARVFYGSVAVGILQRVDRPLLIIRSTGDEQE
jgi:nucleotide-binding universal stress UspA family protein